MAASAWIGKGSSGAGWLGCAVAVLLGACSSTPPNDCAWVQKIAPDAGFEARWTLAEKRQVVAHNEAVARFCR